jgi:hypothetical protein
MRVVVLFELIISLKIAPAGSIPSLSSSMCNLKAPLKHLSTKQQQRQIIGQAISSSGTESSSMNFGFHGLKVQVPFPVSTYWARIEMS